MIRQINTRKNSPNQKNAHLLKAGAPLKRVEIVHSGIKDGWAFENILIKPGIRMLIARHESPEGLRMEYEIGQAPVSFGYTVSGRNRCTITRGEKKGTILQRMPGDSMLAYLPETGGVIDIPAQEKIYGISIHFSVPAFRALFCDLPPCLAPFFTGKADANEIRPFYRQTRYGPQTAVILEQILSCPYQGEIRRLFLEAKSLELVALQLMKMGQNRDHAQQVLKSRDTERVKEAFHILSDSLDHPLSLDELSRRVGINRNRLNQGFRQIYGDTAFNVLRHLRLKKAMAYLRDTDLSLSEIAFSVGYNNQSNFSTAFRRQYGIAPNSMRLQRRQHRNLQ